MGAQGTGWRHGTASSRLLRDHELVTAAFQYDRSAGIDQSKMNVECRTDGGSAKVAEEVLATGATPVRGDGLRCCPFPQRQPVRSRAVIVNVDVGRAL